jgi:hypothetical protein
MRRSIAKRLAAQIFPHSVLSLNCDDEPSGGLSEVQHAGDSVDRRCDAHRTVNRFATDLVRAQLAVRPFAEPAPQRRVGAVWRKSSTRTAAIRAVCDIIAAERAP